jgi:FAD/FMN-containing dehydrogenase
MAYVTSALIDQFSALLGASNIITEGESLETLSKDFYWYSPILKEALKDKRAEVAVRPGSVDQLKAVISLCHGNRVPLVMRGGGTGNYGQCIPLHGGVVVDLTRLDRIIEITTDGILRAEPGVRLGTIEPEARKLGWELRCMPSTWVKSSLAGFLCGGSGGIGSITWGGLAAPGTIKSVSMLTCEAEPRLLKFEEPETLRTLHTYGTTGIMVEIEMRLAPKVSYDQLICSHADWDTLTTWTDRLAKNSAWRKRLVSASEWPVPSYFTPLRKHIRPGESASLIIIDQADTDAVVADAAAHGINIAWRSTMTEPPKPPFVSDYSYNHTTLWAMKSDPSLTYFQAGFAPNFNEQCALIRQRFPGEVLQHFEWAAGTTQTDATGRTIGDAVGMGAIPMVKFTTVERLREIMAYCREIGMRVTNIHAFRMEERGTYPNIADKYALKAETDPAGILNPGKLSLYPVNPFVETTPVAK